MSYVSIRRQEYQLLFLYFARRLLNRTSVYVVHVFLKLLRPPLKQKLLTSTVSSIRIFFQLTTFCKMKISQVFDCLTFGQVGKFWIRVPARLVLGKVPQHFCQNDETWYVCVQPKCEIECCLLNRSFEEKSDLFWWSGKLNRVSFHVIHSYGTRKTDCMYMQHANISAAIQSEPDVISNSAF